MYGNNYNLKICDAWCMLIDFIVPDRYLFNIGNSILVGKVMYDWISIFYCVMHNAIFIIHDAYCKMHDAVCIMHDAWFMMHDAWSKATRLISYNGQWNLHDAWCITHYAWCMMHDAWCMIYGRWFIMQFMTVHNHILQPNLWQNAAHIYDGSMDIFR